MNIEIHNPQFDLQNADSDFMRNHIGDLNTAQLEAEISRLDGEITLFYNK